MTTQLQTAPQSVPVAVANVPLEKADDARPPEQKAQAKAQKKARKHERLRFFFGWCESCLAFGSGF